MDYYTFTVTFVCAYTSRAICVSSVNSMSSENSRRTSTASTIQEMLEMSNSLNIYQKTCSDRPDSTPEESYCHEFIKENNDYFTIKHVLEIKMNETQSILAELLALERKAIVCRGMRYLLAITIYGALVNFASDGPTGEPYVSEKDIFDDLFRTESKKYKIEEIRKFVNDGFVNVHNALNDTTDRGRETVEEHGETRVRSFIEKIKYIVRAIQPFTTESDDFRDFDEITKMINSIKVNAKTSRRSLFAYVFTEINGAYVQECYPGVEVTSFLGADNVEKIVRKNYSATRLAEETDWLFEEVKRDMGTLHVRWFYVNNKQRFDPNVSMMYFHAFNKYYDANVWRLIGDEMVVAHRSASSRVQTSLDHVASRTERQIDRISEDLNVSIHNGMRCRCVVYVNLMTKLWYYVVRVLIENARDVQRLAVTLGKRQKSVGEFVKKVSEDGARHIAATTALEEFEDVFGDIHGEMDGIGIDGHASDGDISDAISSTIDMLSSRQLLSTVEKEFKSVFVVYSMFNLYSINEAVEVYQSKTNYIDTRFIPMLRDLKQTTFEVDSTTVQHILKWYKWGLQTYKDNCNSGILTNISDKIKLKLSSLVLKIDVLNSNLESDIVQMSKLFNL